MSLKKKIARCKNSINLRTKFSAFIILIHLILIFTSVQLIKDHKILFMLSEIGIIISIIISMRLYQSFISPLNLITAGVESMKDSDFNLKFLKVNQYELDKLIEVYNRMMEELRSERLRLREKNYFLEKLIEASPTGIITFDLDHKITSVNRAASQILGVDSSLVKDKSLENLSSPISESLNRLQSGESITVKSDSARRYKCERSNFIDNGFHHHFILIQEMTDEIMASEKRAYGKVIRMMSHEINNSIGAVNSILESCLNYTALKDENAHEYASALKVAVERNSQLNHFMSNFADVVRLPNPNKVKQNINNLIISANTLFKNETDKRNINWRIKLAETPVIIHLDISLFERVLVNIIRNAIEAIDQNGEITIITTLEPDPCMIIKDNGCGINAEIQKNLFLPFYSTKKNGQGIGLTLIREILVMDGFYFSLETTTEGQTEFTIRFNQ